MDHLVPLFTPETNTYVELKHDIFDE